MLQPTKLVDVLAKYKTLANTLLPSVYVSTPMTTGLAYVQAKKSGSVDKAAIFSLNCAHAVAVGKMIEDKIINPVDFKQQEGWINDDYLTMWKLVIENYVTKIVFCDGWQYSHGCCYEFMIATANNIAAYDEHGELITKTAGKAMIAEAIDTLSGLGDDSEFLKKVLGSCN